MSCAAFSWSGCLSLVQGIRITSGLWVLIISTRQALCSGESWICPSCIPQLILVLHHRIFAASWDSWTLLSIVPCVESCDGLRSAMMFFLPCWAVFRKIPPQPTSISSGCGHKARICEEYCIVIEFFCYETDKNLLLNANPFSIQVSVKFSSTPCIWQSSFARSTTMTVCQSISWKSQVTGIAAPQNLRTGGRAYTSLKIVLTSWTLGWSVRSVIAL